MNVSIYPGFEVDKQIQIEELNCRLTQLTHRASGARVLHIGNDDPENVFCLSFQTVPFSSNGVAHILEHTVLCGSEKYPVKDPFFGMLRRSLNTFMNAMTGDDVTFYPAASQVPKDLYNLLDVYLDAVFFPKLNELSFLQEGHRLEFSKPLDPHSPLRRRGIVYNEMKGAMASPDSRMWHKLVETLYPDSPYRFNSGGDPEVISELTHEELVRFHRLYYHPSRCLFFFYGNLPLEKHLEIIEEQVLRGVEPVPPPPTFPHQPRFSEPSYVKGHYPATAADDLAQRVIITFGWLTCDVLNPLEILALSVLEILLMGTDAAPLKQVLLKSGLCKEASMLLGADMLDVPLVLTLKGCSVEAANLLEKSIWAALRLIAEEPIPQDRIDAAIHQLEFGRTEIVGDSSPYGLTLFRRSAPLLLHGGNPEDGLMVHSLFRKLRRSFEDPHYCSKLIHTYLLDNPHRCQVLMEPDPDLAAREEVKEREVLDHLKEELPSNELRQIFKQSQALFEAQRSEPNFSVLPTVTLGDIDPVVRDYPLETVELGGFHLFHHACFTNQIVYATLHFDLPEIAPEDLALARFFYSILPEIGCGGRDYKASLEYQLEHTGGIYSGCSLHPQADNIDLFKPAFSVGGKALHRKVDKLFPYLLEMLTSPDVTDRQRLQELLLQHYSGLENSINQNALHYATAQAAAHFSMAGRIANRWRGLEYLWTIRRLAKDLHEQLDWLVARLSALQQQLLQPSNATLILSCDREIFEQLKSHRFYGLVDLPLKAIKPFAPQLPMEYTPSQGRIIPSPVAFTCQMIRSVTYIHPDCAALTLAAALFDHKTLHRQIREEGGAYGSGAVNNPLGGQFFFYSFRDPHLAATLQAFQDAATEVGAQNFNEQELEEAKFTVIQKTDSPVSPGSRASLAYSWLRDGKAHYRQLFRDQLLGCTRSQVAEAVSRHIIPRLLVPSLNSSVTVSFASKEFLLQENYRLEEKGEEPLAILPV